MRDAGRGSELVIFIKTAEAGPEWPEQQNHIN